MEFRAPDLGAAAASQVAETVRDAAIEARSARSLHQIIGAISRAAVRLADPDDMTGAEARECLGAELGWSRSLVSETLVGMARSWTAAALERLVRSELGDPCLLETFRQDPGDASRWRRALGPLLLFVVHAGNVPGVAVTATIRGLLIRSGVLCKTPEAEPGLVPVFARSLADVDPLLSSSLAATWWPGDKFGEPWEAWSRRSGRVVVYGGETAVRSVRARVRGDTDVVTYGPGVGVAVVRSEAGSSEASALARDLCAYEQQGCVSPRLVYVMADSAGPFARALAAALAEETRRLDVPPPTPAEAVAIRAARASREFSAHGGGGDLVLGSDRDLSWTVLVHEGPGIESESLPRVAYVYRVADVAELVSVLEPLAGRIQTLGYTGGVAGPDLAEGAAYLGVSRVAPFGTLAWPPVDWRHEGRHQLLPLVDWTDLETAR